VVDVDVREILYERIRPAHFGARARYAEIAEKVLEREDY